MEEAAHHLPPGKKRVVGPREIPGSGQKNRHNPVDGPPPTTDNWALGRSPEKGTQAPGRTCTPTDSAPREIPGTHRPYGRSPKNRRRHRANGKPPNHVLGVMQAFAPSCQGECPSSWPWNPRKSMAKTPTETPAPGKGQAPPRMPQTTRNPSMTISIFSGDVRVCRRLPLVGSYDPL